MDRPLRYILVGTGGFGLRWCRDFLPPLAELGKAEPVAAVDINPEALSNAQDHLKLSANRCYTDIEQAFIATQADFVIIVVPPAHHEQVVDLALGHDMHILSEKPIADTMEACCRVYHKVKGAGKKMAVTMSHRFDQDKQSLERAVKSGKYGPLNYIVHRFTHNCRKFGSWNEFRHKIPDPLLIEGAVHHFDILRVLSGSNAREVFALTWNPPWGEYAGDSTGLITMDMQNGVKCLYEGAKANASTLNGWGKDYIRAECCDGTLELDRRHLRVWRGGPWKKPESEDIPLLEQPAWTNQWLAEMFCDWLAGGPAPPNDLDDNIHCAALLFAAIHSAHTHAVVNVPEFLDSHLNSEEA